MSGLVFIFTLISLVVLATQPDLVLEELRRQNPDLEAEGITESLLLTTSFVSGALAMAWSAVAVVLAVLMAGRRPWAARGLLLCAGACALLCLIATFASPVALIPAVAAIATVSCLRRPEVRAWLGAHRADQRERSTAASRCTPAVITSGSLQNAQRTRCRPASWSS